MEETPGNKDSIVERLRAEGVLNRNTGTHSIKSLKEVISKESNPILIEIRDKLSLMVKSIEDQTLKIKDQTEEQKEKIKDDKRKERLKVKDSDSGLIKSFKENYKTISDKLDGLGKTFKESVGKLKDFGADAGSFLKKALAVGVIGVILKDVVDQWTGGAVTEFIESLKGENGLISRVLATGAALATFGLILAPTSTLTLGFMALKGIVKTGGVLLNGLGAMGRLLRSDGRLLRGLGDLTGALGFGGRRGSAGKGLIGSIGGLLSMFRGLIGKLSGRAGLIALIGAVSAGFTGLMSLFPEKTPTPDTPRVNEPDTPRTADTDTARTADTPRIVDADTRSPAAPEAPTGDTTTRTVVVEAEDTVVDRRAPAQISAPDVDTPANVAPRLAIAPDTTSPEAPRAPSADTTASPRPATIVDTPVSADTPARIAPPVTDMSVSPTVAAKVVSPGRKAAIVAKAVGKAGLKSIPILGAVLGAGLTAVRAYMGDKEGAVLEGAATFAPGVVGLPADIALAVHDVVNDLYYEKYGVYPYNDTETNRVARIPEVREEAAAMVQEALGMNVVKDEEAAMMVPVRVMGDTELSTMNDPASPNYQYATTMGISGVEALQERYSGKAMAEASRNQIRTENAARYSRGATSPGAMGDGLRGTNVISPTNVKGGDNYSSVTNNYYTTTNTDRSIDPALPISP